MKPIFSGLNMMDPTDSIEQVKAYIRKCGEKLKLRCKVMVVRNYRMIIEYLEGPEPGYSWYSCVTK